jgi:hypothetical protein
MKFEVDEICQSCHGTGVFIGMGERNGAAVVCSTCDGTGKHHYVHEYEEFKERVDNPKVKWVIETNPGIGIGQDVEFKFEDFGGMNYKDWKKTGKFPIKSEMRKFTCPAWWYQSADYTKKPHWNECIGCGSFSGCSSFATKELCWKRFDKENNIS